MSHSFSIEYRQYLSPDGVLADGAPGLATQFVELTKLYQLMTLTRTFDAKAVALQRTGKLGTYASCLGHEAAHVGMGTAMRPEDCFAPMYREYGAQFARGVKMSEVLLYWGGDERGNDFSGPRHDFAWCVPIATQCLHAAGAALAFKLKREPRVAVGVVGDGGTSKSDFNSAVNAAGAWQLPLVLVIVNNQWAISVPRKAQTGAETLAQKGIAGGIRSLQVDGNDVIAMRAAMDEALALARAGRGPTLIEAITYRLSDHTTADDARRYRDQAEVDDAWTRDPIPRLKRYLEAQGQWDADREELWKKTCAKKVEDAVAEYAATPKPELGDMFDSLYAELPHALRAQRAHALQFPELGHGH
jgi:2-oxoisovalerate dehydrogenase E1 component alpha subunit